jgi:hypothetical protein
MDSAVGLGQGRTTRLDLSRGFTVGVEALWCSVHALADVFAMVNLLPLFAVKCLLDAAGSYVDEIQERACLG